jgi:cytochrome c peroxidase
MRGNSLKKCMYAKCMSLMIIMLISITSSWSMDLHTWTEDEKAVLKSLWIKSLPPIPEDPSNKYSADPKAVAFGKKLFFDSRLSGNLKVSCATCHPQNMNFADNLPLAHGMGTTNRRTMPLVGLAYNTWLFWDGRKDSLWAQALGPIESAVEHGFTRTQCASVIIKHYKRDYEEIFGLLPMFSKRDLPPLAKPSPDEPSALKAWVSMPREKKEDVNRIYANMGKAIAAFVRTIIPTPSRFDYYVEAAVKNDPAAMMRAMTNDEVKGLRLFIGKARCTNCHSEPLFTNGEFHNIGLSQPENLPPDNGRSDAIAKVLSDEFNCMSDYSDAKRADCAELRFIDTATYKYIGAFKTPTLRNVAERAPYMHAGQIPTLRKVLEFYRDLKAEQKSAELEHGNLNDTELSQLESFLRTLSSPLRFAE